MHHITNNRGMRINPALPRCDDIQLALLQHREQQLRQRQHQQQAGQTTRPLQTPEARNNDHADLRRRIAEQIRTALNSERNTVTQNAKATTQTTQGGQIHA